MSDPTPALAFMNRFEETWRAPTPEKFAALFHPEGRFMHPSMSEPRPASTAAGYFHDVLRATPDISLEVRRWAAPETHVLIEYSLSATLDGHRVSWNGADRFTLRGERALEGVAYYDPAAPLAALERSRALAGASGTG